LLANLRDGTLDQARIALDTSAPTTGGGTIASNAPSDFKAKINGIYFNSASGDDEITGSRFNDFIRAGAGDDVIMVAKAMISFAEAQVAIKSH
jgi:hypothetical protein